MKAYFVDGPEFQFIAFDKLNIEKIIRALVNKYDVDNDSYTATKIDINYFVIKNEN